MRISFSNIKKALNYSVLKLEFSSVVAASSNTLDLEVLAEKEFLAVAGGPQVQNEPQQ
jgi:hypothetical protein